MPIYTNQDENLYKVREITSLRAMIDSGASLFSQKPSFSVKMEKGGDYQDITFSQLKADVYALGTYLINAGLTGEKIGIIGANSYQWMVAYFAIVCGVGVAVPLDKELSCEEIDNLIETADCKAIFFTEKYQDKIQNSKVEYRYKMNVYHNQDHRYKPDHIWNMIAQGQILLDKGDTSYIDITIDEDALAVILFTSGTTGIPKGVMLSNKNIASVLMSTSQIVKLHEDDKALSILPIHHTFESTMGIMVVLYQGGCIAICEGLKYVLKNIQESQASILVAVPLVVESIYNKIWRQAEKNKKATALRAVIKTHRTLMSMGVDKRRTLFRSVYKSFGGKLRMIICGAAPLKPSTVRGFMALGFNLSQGYGLTETSPLVAGVPDYEMKVAAIKAGSCGPVVPGGELKIFQPGEDGIGEIIYRGPNVMLGYYNMPEETAKVIKDGWFHTGDLGFVDDMGWLYLTGRLKNVIVTKTGKNIYPEELELLVNQLPGVLESMVYGMEEEGGSDIIVVAQIIADKETYTQDVSDEVIYEHLREEIFKLNTTLPSYKRIRNIILREEDFIKTTTKKIKRQANL